jgi:hypothetical protein
MINVYNKFSFDWVSMFKNFFFSMTVGQNKPKCLSLESFFACPIFEGKARNIHIEFIPWVLTNIKTSGGKGG